MADRISRDEAPCFQDVNSALREACRLADDCCRAGRYSEALRWYSEAIRLHPENHVVYTNRSAVYQRMGDHAAALEDAKQAAMMDPHWWKAYVRQGTSLLRLSRPNDALRAFIKALLLRKGDSSALTGLLASAREIFKNHNQSCLEHLKRRDVESSTFLALTVIGQGLLAIGDARLAVDTLEASLKVGSANLRFTGSVLSSLSFAYWSLRAYDSAISYMREDLRVEESINEPAGMWRACNNLVLALARIRKFAEADILCERLVSITESLGDETKLAHALSVAGLIYARVNRNEQSKSAHLKATKIYLSQGDMRSAARQLLLVSSRCQSGSDFNSAITFSKESLRLSQALTDQALEQKVSLRLAELYLHSNQHELCVQLCTELLQPGAAVTGSVFAQKVWSIMGNAFVLTKRWKQAVSCFKNKLHLALERRDTKAELSAYCEIGCALMNAGNVRHALKVYKACLLLCERVQDREGRIIALGNIASAYSTLGESDQAKRFFKMALEEATLAQDRRSQCRFSAGLGIIFMSEGDWARAEQHLSTQIELASEIRDEDSFFSGISNLGKMLLTKGAWKEAVISFERYLAMARSTHRPAEEINAMAYLAFSKYSLGMYRDAAELYESSIKLAKAVHSNDIGEYYSNLISCHIHNESFPEAIQTSYEFIDWARQSLSQRDLCLSLQCAAESLLKAGSFDNAVMKLKEHLKLSEASGDQLIIASSHSLLGKVYLTSKRFGEAVKHFKVEVNILLELGPSRRLVAGLFNLLEGFLMACEVLHANEVMDQLVPMLESTELQDAFIEQSLVLSNHLSRSPPEQEFISLIELITENIFKLKPTRASVFIQASLAYGEYSWLCRQLKLASRCYQEASWWSTNSDESCKKFLFPSLLGLSMVYRDQGRLELAMSTAVQALALTASDNDHGHAFEVNGLLAGLAFLSGSTDTAQQYIHSQLSIVGSWSRVNHEQRASFVYRVADILLTAERYEEAASLLASVLDRRPKESKMFSNSLSVSFGSCPSPLPSRFHSPHSTIDSERSSSLNSPSRTSEGDSHDVSLFISYRLGYIYLVLGQLEKARDLLEWTIEGASHRGLGDLHLATLGLLADVAWLSEQVLLCYEIIKKGLCLSEEQHNELNILLFCLRLLKWSELCHHPVELLPSLTEVASRASAIVLPNALHCWREAFHQLLCSINQAEQIQRKESGDHTSAIVCAERGRWACIERSVVCLHSTSSDLESPQAPDLNSIIKVSKQRHTSVLYTSIAQSSVLLWVLSRGKIVDFREEIIASIHPKSIFLLDCFQSLFNPSNCTCATPIDLSEFRRFVAFAPCGEHRLFPSRFLLSSRVPNRPLINTHLNAVSSRSAFNRLFSTTATVLPAMDEVLVVSSKCLLGIPIQNMNATVVTYVPILSVPVWYPTGDPMLNDVSDRPLIMFDNTSAATYHLATLANEADLVAANLLPRRLLIKKLQGRNVVVFICRIDSMTGSLTFSSTTSGHRKSSDPAVSHPVSMDSTLVIPLSDIKLIKLAGTVVVVVGVDDWSDMIYSEGLYRLAALLHLKGGRALFLSLNSLAMNHLAEFIHQVLTDFSAEHREAGHSSLTRALFFRITDTSGHRFIASGYNTNSTALQSSEPTWSELLVALLKNPHREGMKVLLHMVEKARQRVLQAKTSQMYTELSSLCSRVGPTVGWQTMLEHLGFRIQPAKDLLPDVIFYPGVDHIEKLNTASDTLYACLGLKQRGLDALSLFLKAPHCSENLIELFRHVVSKFEEGVSYVECELNLDTWRHPGVHDFLANLNFDVVGVNGDQVALRSGRHDLKRPLRCAVRILCDILDLDDSASDLAEVGGDLTPHAELRPQSTLTPLRRMTSCSLLVSAADKDEFDVVLQSQDIAMDRQSSPSSTNEGLGQSRPRGRMQSVSGELAELQSRSMTAKCDEMSVSRSSISNESSEYRLPSTQSIRMADCVKYISFDERASHSNNDRGGRQSIYPNENSKDVASPDTISRFYKGYLSRRTQPQTLAARKTQLDTISFSKLSLPDLADNTLWRSLDDNMAETGSSSGGIPSVPIVPADLSFVDSMEHLTDPFPGADNRFSDAEIVQRSDSVQKIQLSSSEYQNPDFDTSVVEINGLLFYSTLC